MVDTVPVPGRDRRRWPALVTLLIAEAMNLLDATIVTVAGPVIRTDFGGSAADIQWFGAAYTLPFAVLLVAGGRLGDLLGRRRVFEVGVWGFALASLGCALAPSAGVLIGLRAVQGAAAALVIPQTIGLIRAMFDGRDLARALGTIGPVMGLTAILGPVLGAALTRADLFGSSWRACFLVNLPPAVFVLATSRWLPGRRDEEAAARPGRLDLPGTAMLVLAGVLVVHPLIRGGSAGRPLWVWLELCLGTVLLAGFGLQQVRAARAGRSTLIELSLFRGHAFPAALATSALFFAVFNGLMLVVVLQVQLGLGSGVLAAGLALVPWSAAMAVASVLAGTRLVPRYGAKLMVPGLLTTAAGVVAALALCGLPRPHAYPWALFGALATAGFGSGLFTVPFFTAALDRVQAHETGSAAGLLNAVQQFGSTLGTAVLGSVFFDTMGSGGDPVDAAARAARLAFAVALGLLAATLLTAHAMRKPLREKRNPAVADSRRLDRVA